MKRFILTLFTLCYFINTNALIVLYKSQMFEGKTYLIMMLDYDRDMLITDPLIVNFHLLDGTVFRLEGDVAATRNKSSNGLGIKDDSNHYYKFEVTEDMIKSFEKGIKGVTINTIPNIYRDRFSKSNSEKLIKLVKNPKETDDLDQED